MAKTVVHEIVSNVDTIIVLRNPAVYFAEWESPELSALIEAVIKESAIKRRTEEEEERVAMTISGKKTKKGKPKKGKKKMVWDVDEAPQDVSSPILEDLSTIGIAAGEGSNNTEQGIFGGGPSNDKRQMVIPSGFEPEESGNKARHSNGVEIITNVQVDTGPKVEPEVEPEVEPGVETEAEPLEEEGIHFHVCSGNLMSASPWFDRILKKDGWMEAHPNGEDGRFRIAAEDWDKEAFVILMNIFHLRNREVPRTVTLEMLAKIAVLADYYECSESIELFTDMWIAHLRTKVTIPTIYCRDLVLWIWVSWVFKLADPFRQVTAVAIKQSTGAVGNLGLPIPPTITDEIDLRRYQAIEAVISGLHEQLDNYRSATYTCPYGDKFSFPCGSMLLGALTKEMDSAKVFSPRPEAPFADMSFDGICGKMRSVQSAVWCLDYYNRGSHGCGLQTAVDYMIDAILGSTEGLSLTMKDAVSRSGKGEM